MFNYSRLHASLFGLILLWTVSGLESAEVEGLGRQCLRDFPEIYSLQTEGLKLEERQARSYNLLAAKLNVSVEVVTKALAKAVDLKTQKGAASALDTARALFVQRSFSDAENGALAAGDQAHRAAPRRLEEMIAALRLAAYSAMEQQKSESAIKYLTVAVTETDSQKDLATWAALQVGIAHAQKKLGLLDDHERTLWFIFHEHEQRRGADHVETLHHQNELAAYLYERGKDIEAEKQIRLILKATLKVLGHDHADTQASRKNLARLLEIHQKFAEAEKLRRDVYDVQHRLLGEAAPVTLKSREQLILNLMGQGKFAEAEAESFAMTQKASEALGEDAPIVLQGRGLELKAVLAQDKFEAALSLAQALQTDSVRVLGKEHPVTLQAAFSQGASLNQQKHFAEALPILTEVLAARQRTLPASDDAILEAEHQLSIAYLGLDKPKEALDHLRVAITAYGKIHGPSHPKSQEANKTANTLVNTPGGKKVLVDERRASLANSKAKLGADHVQTLAEHFMMATFISSLGLAEEAYAEHLFVMNARRKKLGTDHPHFLDSLRALALLEMDLLKFAESEIHLRELLAKRQKLLKPMDMAIQETRYHLGLCLGRAGKLGDSISLVEGSYLAVKDLEGVNQNFVAQMKATLDQLNAMMAAKPKNFDALAAPAVLTVQKAPKLQGETSKSEVIEVLSNGAGGPALPNAASLVPSDSIQKRIEVKP